MIKRTATLGLIVLAAPWTLAAQQPDTPSYKLPAVIVTVGRTPMRLIDMPLAVTLVQKESFDAANGQRIEEALRGVPGVLAQSRSGGSDIRIVIRGFGARGAGDRSNAGTTRGVRILQDGFPETEPDGRTALDLIDLAATNHVEVVRSNASALWGNAAGGLVNFSSVPINAGDNVRLQYQTGGFGLNRQVLTGNAQLDHSQLYASFAHTKFAGWRGNSGAERSVANIGLVAELGAGTQLSLHAVAADNQFDIPGPLTLTQFNTDPSVANALYEQRRERRRNRIGRLGAQLEHALSTNSSFAATLYVNPKSLQRSERGTYRDFTRHHVGGSGWYRNQHSFSERVRGTAVLGFDEAYQDGAVLFYGLTPDGERDARDLRDNKREGANNAGIYAQEILSFGPMDVTVGARYDNITYDYESRINPKLNDKKTFERVSPKLGVLYRLSENHSVYANVGGGVEAPAGNETDPAGTFGADTVYAINPLLDAIRSTTIEVGTKQTRSIGGFVRTLSYDLALYRTKVTNEIVPYRGGRFYFTAAKAERRGAEIGVSAETSRGIALRTALTLSDNRYRDYLVDSVHYSPSGAGHFADYSDNRIVGVPDRFFTADLSYTPRFLDWLSLSLEMESVAGYFADDANLISVPGYSLVGASVRLRSLRIARRFELSASLRAENLADEQYVSSTFLNPDIVNGEAVAFEPGLPRHVVLSVSVGAVRAD